MLFLAFIIACVFYLARDDVRNANGNVVAGRWVSEAKKKGGVNGNRYVLCIRID